ncbi:pseudouridine-metabolizing bifunctional protein C1861.05-like [Sergentomyia squamirostris]
MHHQRWQEYMEQMIPMKDMFSVLEGEDILPYISLYVFFGIRTCDAMKFFIILINVISLMNILQMNGATYRAETKIYAGGVGRNLADAISKLHGRINFISAVGADQNGAFIRSLMPKNCAILTHPTHATANCAIVLDREGDCKIHVADMQIHSSITAALIERNEKAIADSPIIVIDANLTHDTMEMIFKLCHKHQKPDIHRRKVKVSIAQLMILRSVKIID